MTFYPDGRTDNAEVVSTASGQGVTNPDYRTELEAYLAHKDIAHIMRSNRNNSL